MAAYDGVYEHIKVYTGLQAPQYHKYQLYISKSILAILDLLTSLRTLESLQITGLPSSPPQLLLLGVGDPFVCALLLQVKE